MKRHWSVDSHLIYFSLITQNGHLQSIWHRRTRSSINHKSYRIKTINGQRIIHSDNVLANCLQTTNKWNKNIKWTEEKTTASNNGCDFKMSWHTTLPFFQHWIGNTSQDFIYMCEIIENLRKKTKSTNANIVYTFQQKTVNDK